MRTLGPGRHVNVFHHRNTGLPLDLAWGIATFLNSTIVDLFFGQFNGHTQVNATDLRSLRYPSVDQLVELGEAASPDRARPGRDRFPAGAVRSDAGGA